MIMYILLILLHSGLTTAVGVFENTPSSVLIGIVILAVAMGFCAAAFFDIILFLKVMKIIHLINVLLFYYLFARPIEPSIGLLRF